MQPLLTAHIGREHGQDVDDWQTQNANYSDMQRNSPSRHSDALPQRIPTHVGDVLILRTDQSFSVHAVGLILKDGQQDFHEQVNVKYVRDRAAAMAEAKALVQPRRRIFLWNLDTGKWSEISG